jgi:glycosyltransferase 2 family protein
MHRGEKTERRTKGWIGLVGIGIGLVGLAFAVYALVKAWDEIASARFVPRSLMAAAIVGIAGMTTIGWNWVRIIRLSGESAHWLSGLRWYFVGQLGKYIPGGLWAVLGRGELATRGGVGRAVSYTSVGVSLATTYAAAATVGALLLAFGASSLSSRLMWMALSAATVIAAVFGLAEPMVRRIETLASRFRFEVNLPSTTPRASLMAIFDRSSCA